MNYHGGTEAQSKLLHEELTERVIGAAIEVHRALGPLESSYEECLCHELNLRGISFKRQLPLPVEYKGVSWIVVIVWIWLLTTSWSWRSSAGTCLASA
jgi:hypothetical protein